MAVNKPGFIAELIGPLKEEEFIPTTIDEWEKVKKISTILSSWENQQEQERSLRGLCAKWVFGLITFEIFALFSLVFLHGFGFVSLNQEMIKILLPSVLFEVVGMGFLVVKYLFRHPSKELLELLPPK